MIVKREIYRGDDLVGWLEFTTVDVIQHAALEGIDVEHAMSQAAIALEESLREEERGVDAV